MKKSIANKLRMYNAVIEVCRDHQLLWENIPGYVSALEEFENRVEILRLRSGIRSNITSGVSDGKRSRLEALYDQLLVVHSALWVYAASTNNFQLMSRNKVTMSDLKRLSIVRLDAHLNNIIEDINEHGEALLDFGITSEFLNETIELINVGSYNARRPRMAIIERKMLTQSLTTISHDLDNLLRFKLDKLMNLFRKSNADFYSRYHNARMIIDLRGPTRDRASDVDP